MFRFFRVTSGDVAAPSIHYHIKDRNGKIKDEGKRQQPARQGSGHKKVILCLIMDDLNLNLAMIRRFVHLNSDGSNPIGGASD
jgi:hypothetical protein